MILIYPDLWDIYHSSHFLCYFSHIFKFRSNVYWMRRCWSLFLSFDNFWHTRIAANKAALKAMIVNRIADVFSITGILYILLLFKTTDYITVIALVPYVKETSIFFFNTSFSSITFISFFLFLGAIVNQHK